MNEHAATQAGLHYDGPTAKPWNAKECEELKRKAAEIRKLGFKAVVVQSGQNEWGGGSKLLYVDENYSLYRRAKETRENWLASYEVRKKYITDKHKQELQKFEDDMEERRKFVTDAELKLNRVI